MLALFSGDGGAASVESGEDSSHALREHVHVRKKPSLDDHQIEGTVEINHVSLFITHCHCGGITVG